MTGCRGEARSGLQCRKVDTVEGNGFKWRWTGGHVIFSVQGLPLASPVPFCELKKKHPQGADAMQMVQDLVSSWSLIQEEATSFSRVEDLASPKLHGLAGGGRAEFRPRFLGWVPLHSVQTIQPYREAQSGANSASGTELALN